MFERMFNGIFFCIHAGHAGFILTIRRYPAAALRRIPGYDAYLFEGRQPLGERQMLSTVMPDLIRHPRNKNHIIQIRLYGRNDNKDECLSCPGKHQRAAAGHLHMTILQLPKTGVALLAENLKYEDTLPQLFEESPGMTYIYLLAPAAWGTTDVIDCHAGLDPASKQ